MNTQDIIDILRKLIADSKDWDKYFSTQTHSIYNLLTQKSYISLFVRYIKE